MGTTRIHRAVVWSAVLALLATTGCSASKPPATPPDTPPGHSGPPSQPEPARRTPETLGLTRVGQGPGLVVQGWTEEKKLRVEMRNGTTLLQAADVTPKDDGGWSIVWPAPQGAGVHVQVSTPEGKALIGGVVGLDMNVGLFYGGNFSGVNLLALPQEQKLKLTGTTSLQGGGFVVQVRKGETVLASHLVTASQTGTFTATVDWAAGATVLWLYSVDGQGKTVNPQLIVPIITHGE